MTSGGSLTCSHCKQTVVETWKTPDVLGLHPRDVYLFASDVGIGQRAMLAARSGWVLGLGGPPTCRLLRVSVPACPPAGWPVHRACLPAYPTRSAILFRTDVCKGVVYGDKAVLFPCRQASPFYLARGKGGVLAAADAPRQPATSPCILDPCGLASAL